MPYSLHPAACRLYYRYMHDTPRTPIETTPYTLGYTMGNMQGYSLDRGYTWIST